MKDPALIEHQIAVFLDRGSFYVKRNIRSVIIKSLGLSDTLFVRKPLHRAHTMRTYCPIYGIWLLGITWLRTFHFFMRPLTDFITRVFLLSVWIHLPQGLYVAILLQEFWIGYRITTVSDSRVNHERSGIDSHFFKTVKIFASLILLSVK